MLWLDIFTIIVFTFCAIFSSLNQLYRWQIKSYKWKKYLNIKNNHYEIILKIFISACPVLLIIFIKNHIFDSIFTIFFVFLWLFFEFKKLFRSKKIGFNFTPKIWRLLTVNFLLLVSSIIVIFLTLGGRIFCISLCSLVIVHEITFIVLLLISIPIESLINHHYIWMAKNKLAHMQDLVKIGVTGSVGKTSVKRYLNTLIKDDVFASRKSFNTTLGIARSINEMPTCKVFIAEMGARKRGQIKQLCDIVKPNMAIITNVSMAHIETYKNIDNIYLAKKELSDNCNGIVVFNIDNPYVHQMYNERTEKKISVSIDAQADYWAENIKADSSGCTFIAHTPNNKYDIKTDLIGRHNILNIMLAAACACQIVPEDVVMQRIRQLKAEEHRLQLLQNAQGVNIIDDSYNASEASIHAALSALSLFEGRKYIASPGMVEGGKMQYAINYNFGAVAGKMVDGFFVINKTNRKAIVNGLQSVNCQNIYIADTLDKAKEMFSNVLKSGDTLLILNDLPDDYK